MQEKRTVETVSRRLAGFYRDHRRMPAYRATTLYDCPELARRCGVGRVLVKAETQRLGLPSFKILGASWATYRALCDHLGFEPEPWANINDLSRRIAYLRFDESEVPLMEMMRFDGKLYNQAYSFKYSPRPGTKAATLPDQVPATVKRARSQQLHELARRLKGDRRRP